MILDMFVRLGVYLRLGERLEWFKQFYERVKRMH